MRMAIVFAAISFMRVNGFEFDVLTAFLFFLLAIIAFIEDIRHAFFKI
jgi:hypothetical protein